MMRIAIRIFELVCAALTFLIFVALYAMSNLSEAAEVTLQYGDASWSRCSGSACWDNSGDPRFPLPVTFDTRSSAFALGARAGELELAVNWLAQGHGVVRGRFVDDQFFDAKTRSVVGTPTRVIDAEVAQWTAGMRAVWAPRWTIWQAVWLQPDLGVYLHHTRWAITWSAPQAIRGDGGGWSATPTGGLKLGIDTGHGTVVTGVEVYHRPTVLNAPLGGNQRKGPGLVVAVVELRVTL